MGQKYTVYYKKKCILINNMGEDRLKSLELTNDQLSQTLKESSIELIKSDAKKLKIKHRVPNIHEAFEILKSQFTYIEAAGGLIVNQKNQVLMINRLDVWDLPKGKIERGETPAKAAQREVSEECGIPYPWIIKDLPSTYHIYKQSSKWYLKKTYWFLMRGDAGWSLIPQKEEGIMDIKWMNELEVKDIIGRTYPAIGDILKFHNKTKEQAKK
jgi:ADP-ribose pyrophosphatase YjhB (NUDIX family)